MNNANAPWQLQPDFMNARVEAAGGYIDRIAAEQRATQLCALPAGDIDAQLPPETTPDTLIDLALACSALGATEHAVAILRACLPRLGRESEAMRILCRLLSSRALDLASTWTDAILAHIPTQSTRLKAVEFTRRESFRLLAAGTPMPADDEVDAVCERFAELSLLLRYTRAPVRSRPVYTTSTSPHAEPLAGDTVDEVWLQPTPPWTVAPDGSPRPNRQFELRESSGRFALLRQARMVGGYPTLYFDDHVIDDWMTRYPDPAEFTAYIEDDRSHYLKVLHYFATRSGKRYAIIVDALAQRKIARGILLNGPYHWNYYHWLCEYLIHLPAINALPECYRDWPLIVSRDAFQHPNLLAALRLAMASCPRRLEIIDSEEAVEVGELIVPPRYSWFKPSLQTRAHIDARDRMLAAPALQALHGLLALPPARPGGKRLFMVRTGKTRVTNQQETIALFARHGFETVFPERMRFDDARRLFAQASVIAGPPGAGFANLLLCPRDAIAVVVMPDIGPEAPYFSAIGVGLGQQVIHLCGPTADPEDFNSVFSCDLTLAERLLAKLDETLPPPAEHTPMPAAAIGDAADAPDEGADQAADGNEPLVSILIPAFKPRWFEGALVSALSQTYPNIEVLVFDNCPDERIRDICALYPQAVYYRNPNTGPQNSLDIAAASRGRYVKHLFDDDALEPECVAEMVAAIRSAPEARLAFAKSWQIDERGVRLGIRQEIETPERIHMFDGNALCRAFARDCGNMIGEFSSVLFDGIWLRKDVLRLRRAETLRRELFGLGDVISFMNAAAGRPVAFVNATLTSFRINRESNSNPDRNPDFILAITDWKQIIEEACALGVMTMADLGVAMNSYNKLASQMAREIPTLADEILATLYPSEALPDHAEYLACLAMAQSGQHAEALARLVARVEAGSSHWRIYDLLADLAQAGDDALALSYRELAWFKAGHLGTEHIKYAQLLLAHRQSQKAFQVLQRMLALDPANGEALCLLATQLGEPPLPPGIPSAYVRAQMHRSIGGLTAEDWRRRVAAWPRHLLCEIVLTLRPGEEAVLADTIDALAGQYYDGWRLTVFAQGPAPDPGFADTDGVVRWIELPAEAVPHDALRGHLATASRADWVGFVPCGMQFSPDCLLALFDAVHRHPDWKLVYTDEDRVDADGVRHSPSFKPDFNGELLRATDYIGSVFVARDALLAADVFPVETEAFCFDLVLRLADQYGAQAVGHLPEVLLHAPPGCFTRATGAAADAAVHTHLARHAVTAEIAEGPLPGILRRIVYRHDDEPVAVPGLSIIVPTRNRLELLQPCIESLFRHTDYANWEVLLVDNGSDDPAVLAYYDSLRAQHGEQVRLLQFDAPFNFSAMNNFAAGHARGDYLLLLNNDTECIHDDWLEAMMNHARRSDVGVVGARLLFPDSLKIQHAGVVLGLTGTAGHVFVRDLPHDAPGYLNRAQADQEYSAVTGACLLIRKSLYADVGGLDEPTLAISFSDIDLCLKVRQRNLRVIWTPFATLLHHGSATQSNGAQDAKKIAVYQQECNAFYQRWTERLTDDPAWNPNLSLVYTTPVVEDELAVPWDRDCHDRPRIAAMPVVSNGAAEYRCLTPLRTLHAAGKVHYTSICQPHVGFERAPMPVELARLAPDTLLMHTPVDNVRCQALLRYQRFNPEVFRIYTLDDLITNIPPSNPSFGALPADAMAERLALGLKASHRLIVSTEPLMEACRHLIDDIRLVPNTLEWSVWSALRSRRRRGQKMRVGWAGAQQHAGDLRFMQEVVGATYQEIDWVFLGMAPEGMKPLIAEFHDYVHDFAAYPAKLASLDLDLAVAPLEQHPFNEAKSNLRLLEYGALGWPVICTDILPYRTGNPPVTRLPNDAVQWIAAIRERIAEPDALAREGDALREWTQAGYQLEKWQDEWLSALLP